MFGNKRLLERLETLERKMEDMERAVTAQAEAERRFQEGLSNVMNYQGPFGGKES